MTAAKVVILACITGCILQLLLMIITFVIVNNSPAREDPVLMTGRGPKTCQTYGIYLLIIAKIFENSLLNADHKLACSSLMNIIASIGTLALLLQCLK